jgi:hypothetical protein
MINSPLRSPFPGTLTSAVVAGLLASLMAYLFVRTLLSIIINWKNRVVGFKYLTNIFVALVAAYLFVSNVLGIIFYYLTGGSGTGGVR